MFNPLPSGREMLRESAARNWECNIRDVCVETCEKDEDPLGYRAVFYVEESVEGGLHGLQKTSFVIGATHLLRRARNLERAGFYAPMTGRAVELIERELGLSSSASAAAA